VPRRVSLRPLVSFARAGGLALGLLVGGAARAEDAPRQVVVVDVDPAASAIDAARLRAAIGSDLSADAVAPDDARAAQARGTIHVALGGENRALVVSYLARPETITRTVEVPADPRAIERAAVILAGNLARNEESQLAADLRAQHASPAAATSAGAPPDRATSGAYGAGWDEQRVAEDRLQRTLNYLADRERNGRVAIASACLGLGAAAIGASAYLSTWESSNNPGWPALGTLGVALVIGGGLGFLSDHPLGSLADYHREGAGMVRTEQLWAHFARRERTRRTVGGVLMLALGGLGFGTAVWDYAATTPGANHDWANAIGALATIEVVAGVYELATDGPVESGLREYERSTGKMLYEDAAVLGHLRLGAVRGGATAGFGATF
jgi:hypothetical protein